LARLEAYAAGREMDKGAAPAVARREVGNWGCVAPALHCERGGHRELPYQPRGVNLSVFQLRQKDPVPRGTMHEFSISPKRNELKIADNAFMNATYAVPGTIREREAPDFDLAIDDFGTGFSSLCRLRVPQS
jgi:EAL domain-containing protein (putative c-di-GMP-specific phosphodiesterase class I)